MKNRTVKILIVITAIFILTGLLLLQNVKIAAPEAVGVPTEKTDYLKVVVAFTAFMGAMFTGIKVISDISNRPLQLHLEALAVDTKQQFSCVFATLNVMEDTLVRRNVTESLRAVVRGYIHYNRQIDNRAKMLIDCQCERLVEFSDEVMAEKYNIENWEQTVAKMEVQARKGSAQAAELFGDEFSEQYRVIQRNCLADFKDKLHTIICDDLVNSKYARYKNASETFLHELINETLALVHNWAKHEKRINRPKG